jgi:hypothetical protein
MCYLAFRLCSAFWIRFETLACPPSELDWPITGLVEGSVLEVLCTLLLVFFRFVEDSIAEPQTGCKLLAVVQYGAEEETLLPEQLETLAVELLGELLSELLAGLLVELLAEFMPEFMVAELVTDLMAELKTKLLAKLLSKLLEELPVWLARLLAELSKLLLAKLLVMV